MKNEKEMTTAIRFGICCVVILSLISIVVLMGMELKKEKVEKENWKLLYELSEE